MVCPESSVAEPGAAAIVKVEDAITTSELDEVALWPFAVTTTGPVAAPLGITNERLFALAVDNGAGIVPPPCWFNVT